MTVSTWTPVAACLILALLFKHDFQEASRVDFWDIKSKDERGQKSSRVARFEPARVEFRSRCMFLLAQFTALGSLDITSFQSLF
ncbi:uncharacterized protein K460DRAFT_21401 [Cucurbitaria berberidis CBS 394.84]|uniref:Secreted protein n=1 Tax=Cucurbitaria berberidis CBS 394.84 TaxID=1168544 RepID=A0A9P4GSY8_9PLEO|nr:uncharacterized protein K460DRAFT_21401 [Cucurbitaria berberidis CBS 394.84]KAF1850752.1 hypothetical protein K460DRAFT_21401 [Cucurbitaria berberidis CBS 394.84]